MQQRLQDDYNTQRSKLTLSEFGRYTQNFVKKIKEEPDKEKRSRMARTLYQSMTILNPQLKNQANFEEKLWFHIFQLAEFDLDIDAPYQFDEIRKETAKPERIEYSNPQIKFRFYGKSLHNMVQKAAEIENEDLRTDMINMLASFMFNSCKSWNNEILTTEALAEHLRILSNGKIIASPENLVITQDNSKSSFQKLNQQSKQNFGGHNNNRNRQQNKFNKNNNKNYRKY